MHHLQFEAELKRRFGQEHFVKRDRRQARIMMMHPDCWQVWDLSPRTAGPYFVHIVCAKGGTPREPSERDFVEIQRVSAHVHHAGRKGWIKDMARKQLQRYDDTDLKNAESIHDFLTHEGLDRLLHFTGNRLVVPMKPS